MPGFTTHYILGMKAFHALPNNQLKFIISKYRWLFQLGLQGPDMFFYNFPLARHRDYRNVGSYMHEAYVNLFFKNALKNANLLTSRQKRDQAISYIAGFMCHYIGDAICHPYIYGRINHNPHSPNTYTHALHAALENDIDALLLYKFKRKKPSEFNQAATICLNGFEMQFVSDFLSKIINETFYPITYKNHFQVSPAMVHRSILALRYGCRTLQDPTGKKKKRIGRIENIFLKSHIVSKKLVSDKIEDNTANILNLNHETWTNPWDLRLASTESFPDLFLKSLNKCHNVYHYLNSTLKSNDNLDIDHLSQLLEELGNYSYHSGLECQK